MSVNLKTTWQARGVPETAKRLQFESVILGLRANISGIECKNEKCLKHKQARKTFLLLDAQPNPPAFPAHGSLCDRTVALERLVVLEEGMIFLGDMDGSEWCGKLRYDFEKKN